MTMKGNRYVWMDQATDGTQGAGAGAAGGTGAGAAADQGGAAGATGGVAAPVSALASGAGAGAAGAQSAAGASGFDWLPEKYRVAKDGGEIDLEASAKKVAEGYAHLSQRLGAGDVPPKTPDEYAPKVEAEGFNWDEFKADPEMQSFLKGAHAKGVTNDQLSFILGEYARVAPGLVEGAGALTVEDCNAALSQVWQTPAEQTQNLQHAYRAASTFAGKVGLSYDDIEAAGLGNNPVFIRLMAAIGPELGEDTSPPAAGLAVGMSDADFATQAADLRNQLAQLHVSDKRRPEVQAKLDALYAKRYGTKPQQLGGGAVIQTRA